MNDILATDVYAAVFLGALILSALLIIGAMKLVSLWNSPAGERIQRDHLGKQLAGTRMWSMLEHRHVSPLQYIDRTPIDELREQIKTCRHCAKQELCDETLGYVGWRKRHYGFCPNRSAIDALIRPGAGDAEHATQHRG